MQRKIHFVFQCQQCSGVGLVYKREEEINVYFRALHAVITPRYSYFWMEQHFSQFQYLEGRNEASAR